MVAPNIVTVKETAKGSRPKRLQRRRLSSVVARGSALRSHANASRTELYALISARNAVLKSVITR